MTTLTLHAMQNNKVAYTYTCVWSINANNLHIYSKLEHEEINLITFTLRCLTFILITMCWKSLPERSVEKHVNLGN